MTELIPELKYKRLTYDIGLIDTPPRENDYLVSICGKRGAFKAGSVYLVVASRLVKAKAKRAFNRWHLTVIKCPEQLLNVTVNIHHGHSWITPDGPGSYAVAHSIFWHSRNKK